MNQNLRVKYKEKVVPMLMEQFKYKNIHEVPKITKITINIFYLNKTHNVIRLSKKLYQIYIKNKLIISFP